MADNDIRVTVTHLYLYHIIEICMLGVVNLGSTDVFQGVLEDQIRIATYCSVFVISFLLFALMFDYTFCLMYV